MKIGAISLILVIFLTGCDASSELERGMALRSSLLKAQSCSFVADVTAEYGDVSFLFSLQCTFDEQGNMDFTVLNPDSISGIRGKVSYNGGKLCFDETALFFELLTDEQISPVTAPWILMKTLREGYLTSVCMEDSFLRMTIDDRYQEDALTLDIWVNAENIPVRAEIVYDNVRILSISIRNYGIL